MGKQYIMRCNLWPRPNYSDSERTRFWRTKENVRVLSGVPSANNNNNNNNDIYFSIYFRPLAVRNAPNKKKIRNIRNNDAKIIPRESCNVRRAEFIKDKLLRFWNGSFENLTVTSSMCSLIKIISPRSAVCFAFSPRRVSHAQIKAFLW